MKKEDKIQIEKTSLLISYGVDLDAIPPYVVTDIKKHPAKTRHLFPDPDEAMIIFEIPGLRLHKNAAPSIIVNKEGMPIICRSLTRTILSPKSWSEVIECFQLSKKQLRDVEKEIAAHKQMGKICIT